MTLPSLLSTMQALPPQLTPMKHMSLTMTFSPDSFTGPLNSSLSSPTIAPLHVSGSRPSLQPS